MGTKREAANLGMTTSGSVRSRIMAAVRSRDTGPEMVLRRAMHAGGFRYRLHVKESARDARHVLPEVAGGDFGPRLFLAPARGLQEGVDAEVESHLLVREAPAKR